MMDFWHGDAHSPMCYMIWTLRNILAKNVDFAQFVRYCKDKEEKQGRRRELTMWKKHKHLFLFPAAVLGILAVCWMSGQVSEFNKWYLIIAGRWDYTAGCRSLWSSCGSGRRRRKSRKSRGTDAVSFRPGGRGTFPFRFFILWLVKNGVL